MARTPAPFRQSHVTSAIKAAVAAGQTLARAEIDRDGKIVLVFGDPETTKAASPLEAWEARRNARSS